MDAVVFGACLEEDAGGCCGGQGERIDEVGEKGTVYFD